MLEELLVIFERTVRDNKRVKADFNKSLKKKFMEKADKYSFLDPFAAEFEYSNQKISYRGTAKDEVLAKGIIESIKELANELNTVDQLYEYLVPWTEKYSQKLKGFGVEL